MSAKTVLLIDDSRVARMMARAIVEKAHPACKIIEAGSGEEALAQHDRPDFALVDVNMPGMGGLAAARELKARYPEASITLVTANIQDAIRQQAAEIGVGFIAKPIGEREILAFLSGASAP